jgi:hypothetical protein
MSPLVMRLVYAAAVVIAMQMNFSLAEWLHASCKSLAKCCLARVNTSDVFMFSPVRAKWHCKAQSGLHGGICLKTKP